jgi:hypoxanthine phosphoribosyltransferase
MEARTPDPHQTSRRLITDSRIGEIYLSADELGVRVRELGAEIARDYADREPILVGSLKASFVFLADLSRATRILHGLDFVELAGYGSAQMGGHEQIRVLKDLDADIRDRDVIVVEDVVDTGLTLHYLVRTFELRKPRSIAAVTLLDRPYRRLVDDLPVRYIGFVVPDELFVGYGFDLDERWRQLPDLRLVDLSAASAA